MKKKATGNIACLPAIGSTETGYFTKTSLYIIFFSAILSLLTLNTTAQLYKQHDSGKFSVGELSEPDYNSLKLILLEHTISGLKDSIIIKYDYNNETCWMMLDRESDDRITSAIKLRQLKIQKEMLDHKGASIFRFREKGNNLNKVVEWDGSIIIDKEKKLFRLLFKKRSTCGNSIIILPSRKFILIRSDSHFEALNYSQSQIEEMLTKE